MLRLYGLAPLNKPEKVKVYSPNPVPKLVYLLNTDANTTAQLCFCDLRKRECHIAPFESYTSFRFHVGRFETL